MSPVPDLTLNAGNTDIEIPQLGFGTFQIPPEETAEAVGIALDIGYRHIDTAQMYRNESGVGEALRLSGLARDQVFVTSKLNNPHHRPDDARQAFDDTLEALQLDRVDLFLIHWPMPTQSDGDFVSTWRVLEEFRDAGRARAIGVSNFQVDHLERLLGESGTKPSVNQIEAHPYFRNDEVRAFCHEHDILIEAWAPLAKGEALKDPEVVRIAERLGRAPAQVVLRWHVQRGDIVFPKSVTPSRMRENFDVFEFELDEEAMRAIDTLNRGEKGRIGPHPDRMNLMDT